MKEKDVLLKEQGILDDNEREQFVINWAASALSAAAACAMKFNSKEKEYERASDSLKINSKNGRSGAGIDGNSQQLDDEADIYAACEHPQTLRLLQLLCGVTAVLNSSDKSQRSKGKKIERRSLHFEDTLAASDDEQQVYSILCGSFSLPHSPSALLPPRLHFDHHVLSSLVSSKYLLLFSYCNLPIKMILSSSFFSFLSIHSHLQLFSSTLLLFILLLHILLPSFLSLS